MSDKKELLRSIIDYHHVIRDRTGMLNRSLNDFEALFTLQSEYAGWTQSSRNELSARSMKMEEHLSVLEEGLQKHFHLEEENLPEILGTVMMKGLLHEHNRVRQNLTNIRDLLEEFKRQNAESKDISQFRTRLQRDIGEVVQLIERHAMVEEQVLQLGLEGLENS